MLQICDIEVNEFIHLDYVDTPNCSPLAHFIMWRELLKFYWVAYMHSTDFFDWQWTCWISLERSCWVLNETEKILTEKSLVRINTRGNFKNFCHNEFRINLIPSGKSSEYPWNSRYKEINSLPAFKTFRSSDTTLWSNLMWNLIQKSMSTR